MENPVAWMLEWASGECRTHQQRKMALGRAGQMGNPLGAEGWGLRPPQGCQGSGDELWKEHLRRWELRPHTSRRPWLGAHHRPVRGSVTGPPSLPHLLLRTVQWVQLNGSCRRA